MITLFCIDMFLTTLCCPVPGTRCGPAPRARRLWSRWSGGWSTSWCCFWSLALILILVTPTPLPHGTYHKDSAHCPPPPQCQLWSSGRRPITALFSPDQSQHSSSLAPSDTSYWFWNKWGLGGSFWAILLFTTCGLVKMPKFSLAKLYFMGCPFQKAHMTLVCEARS